MKEPDTGIKLSAKKPYNRKNASNGTQARVNKIPDKFDSYSDSDLQDYLLEGVSRTFALTIPELPDDLETTVSNAYLLCRIVDTIEDEPQLDPSEKRDYCNQFCGVVEGRESAELFSSNLSASLSHNTSPAEHELIELTKRVIRITHSFPKPHRKALERCVRIMSEGMISFQENASPDGLKNMDELNRYCYHVAGVVGEMLTELFCLHSEKISKNKSELMDLSVSFGLGLQMTNIMKDLWEDHERSACWLPQTVFNENGFSLNDLRNKASTPEFREGLKYLIGITNMHLENALKYTLLIPAEETGIRRFCLWAIGMAVLTIRKIYKNIDYTAGNQVKIKRNSVKATILISNLTVKNDFLIKSFFEIARSGIPYQKN